MSVNLGSRTRINDRLVIWSERMFPCPCCPGQYYKIVLVDIGTERMWRMGGHAWLATPELSKHGATYEAYLRLNRFVDEFEKLYE